MASWTTINRPHQEAPSEPFPDEVYQHVEHSEHSYAASRFRMAVLQAAARIANSHCRYERRKRHQGMITTSEKGISSDVVRSLCVPASNFRISKSMPPRSEAIGTAKRAAEPMKCYLKPSKRSRLNEQPKPTNFPPVQYSDKDYYDSFADSTSENDRNGKITNCTVIYASVTYPSPLQGLCEQGPSDAAAGDLIGELEDDHFDTIDISGERMAEAIVRVESAAPSVHNSEDLQSREFLETEDNTAEHEWPIDTKGPSPGSSGAERPTPSPLIQTIAPFLPRSHLYLVREMNNSHLPKLSQTLSIPTCFRIAEVYRLLKSHPQTQPTNLSLNIELYAVVVDTTVSKAGATTFHLADLFFPSRPPYIIGTTERSRSEKRRNSDVSNPQPSVDTESFRTRCSETGDVVCRAVICLPNTNLQPGDLGKTPVPFPPSRQPRPLHVDIKTIRESDQEEVEYVKGIVDPEDSTPVTMERPEEAEDA